MQQLLFPLLWKIPGNSDFREEGWFWLGLEAAELEASGHLASTIKKQSRRGERGVGENRVGRAGEMLSSLCPFCSVWCCPHLDTTINLMWTVCHRGVRESLKGLLVPVKLTIDINHYRGSGGKVQLGLLSLGHWVLLSLCQLFLFSPKLKTVFSHTIHPDHTFPSLHLSQVPQP